jgi:hypothetical protein
MVKFNQEIFVKYLVLAAFLFSGALMADEPVCKKCQVIREYNAAHPENNYYYYDDYLKDQEKKRHEESAPKLACDQCNDKKLMLACDCGGKKDGKVRDN